MSSVVGIDLSSRAVDLVRLDEDQDTATHRRISLEAAGKTSTAWERTLALPGVMPHASWWDDVYLVAIEGPYGHVATVAIINRVVGAVVATLPSWLRRRDMCWPVRPDEWKTGLGLLEKPSAAFVADLGVELAGDWPLHQDARDALCIAYWARKLHRTGKPLEASA